MNFEKLRLYCSTLPMATQDIKWGADLCFSVGGKMFAVFWHKNGKAASVSCKCDAEHFLAITDQPGIIPAPYLARAHWVQIQDSKALTDTQAKQLVKRSYELVRAKLPKISARSPINRARGKD